MMARNTVMLLQLFAIVLAFLMACSTTQAGYIGHDVPLKTMPLGWTFDHETRTLLAFDSGPSLLRIDAQNRTDPQLLVSLLPIIPRALCMGGNSDTLFILTEPNNEGTVSEVHMMSLKTKQLSWVVGNLTNPNDIAFHNGNLFILESGANRIISVPQNGGAVTVVATEIILSKHLSVDSEGNIFFIGRFFEDGVNYDFGLKVIPASNPKNIIHVDKTPENSVLFNDKSNTPNKQYFISLYENELRIRNALFQNGHATLLSPLSIGNVLVKSSFPFFMSRERSFIDMAITPNGDVWHLKVNFKTYPYIPVYEPTSDVTVFFLWAVRIFIIALFTIVPCFFVVCAVISFDIILIILDRFKKSSSGHFVGDREISGSLFSKENSSMRNKRLPKIYVIISIIRNAYFVICSFVFVPLSLFCLYVGWLNFLANGVCDEVGECLLTWAGVLIFIPLGISFFCGFFTMFWSPLYFISSFFRTKPYIIDLIVCILSIASYMTWPLAFLAILPFLTDWAVILIVFTIPVILLEIPALILDAMFIWTLIGIRTGQIKNTSIKRLAEEVTETSDSISLQEDNAQL